MNNIWQSADFKSVSFKPLIVVLVSVLLLSACGGKRKATTEDGQPVVDMTRPPVMIKDISEQQVESDPNEVISFEKWRKERDEGSTEAPGETTSETPTEEELEVQEVDSN